jgi:flagellar hook assembly protein FlgD
MVRHEEDVDHDGDLDLVFHFRQEDAQIACGDQFAVLTGVTFAGREITGQDAVNASGGRGRLARELPAPTLAPNPFNPQTHVMFSLAQSGRVQVSVYDVAGRRVAVVADGMFDAGSQDVLWTGTDDAGRAVSSGVYFVRIEGAGLAVSLRAALLR